jgi:hypothetical protein
VITNAMRPRAGNGSASRHHPEKGGGSGEWFALPDDGRLADIHDEPAALERRRRTFARRGHLVAGRPALTGDRDPTGPGGGQVEKA